LSGLTIVQSPSPKTFSAEGEILSAITIFIL
jgi:hypothetical protein